MTKKGSSFGYKSSHVLRGRGSIGDIFVREVFLFMRDVVRTYVFFFFFFPILDTLFLHCDSKPCTHLLIYIYIYRERERERNVVITFFHLSLHVLFLFSLYAYASYLLYAIFYFCFTLRCCDEFCLKYFRNTGCQSLSCHRLSSCKVFQEFMLG